MDLTDQFWMFFTAVLAANLLTASFIYGMIQYSRAEKEKREDKVGFDVFSAMLLPMALLGIGLYLTLY